MNPYVARAIGAVGAVLGIVAIWVDIVRGGTYWDTGGHSIGIAMLVLAILVLIGIVLASITQLRPIDHVWVLPGLVLGGIAVFIPLSALGNGALDELEAGGWLGVASCGLFLIAGVLVAIPASAPHGQAPATAAAAAPAPPPAAVP